MNTKSKFREYLKRPACGLSLAALLCLAARPAAAQTWDATADFSTTSGQNVLVNGVWSYGTYNHVTASYANIPSNQYDPNGFGQPGLNTWYTTPTGLPAIWKNNGSGPIFGMPVGEMGMHPADPSAEVDHPVLLWTCPATGCYRFNLGWNYYGAWTGVLTSMTRNLTGSTAIGSQVPVGVWNLTSEAPTASFVQTFTMTAGETMAFAVNPGSDNGSDTTGIALTVSKVTTWNASADFSTTSGQNVLVNGAWSYGTYNHVTASYANIPSNQYDPNGFGQPGLNTWYTTPTGLPAIWKNNGSGPIFGMPVGEMGMHPADPSAEVDHPVLLWTCPVAGDYQFNLGWNYYGAWTGVLTSMTRNLNGSTEIGSQVPVGVWNLTGEAPTASFVQTFTLAAGETMAFAVNPGSDYSSDTTGIALTVTAVPAASGYSSWASGFTNPSLSNTDSTADPDNDGLNNTVEYALGLDPRYSSGSPGVPSNNGMTITFTKGSPAKNDSNLTYQIETSPTLGVAPSPWTVDTANVSNLTDTIAITFPPGPVKNFARLKVTLTSP